MKHDIKSNFLMAAALAAISYNAGAANSASVDMSLASSAAFFIDLGGNGAAGTVDAKLQHSDDNATWTDEVAGAGNDTAITQMVTEGQAALYVNAPRARYYRVVVTVGTNACTLAVTSVLGPLFSVLPA